MRNDLSRTDDTASVQNCSARARRLGKAMEDGVRRGHEHDVEMRHLPDQSSFCGIPGGDVDRGPLIAIEAAAGETAEECRAGRRARRRRHGRMMPESG